MFCCTQKNNIERDDIVVRDSAPTPIPEERYEVPDSKQSPNIIELNGPVVVPSSSDQSRKHTADDSCGKFLEASAGDSKPPAAAIVSDVHSSSSKASSKNSKGSNGKSSKLEEAAPLKVPDVQLGINGTAIGQAVTAQATTTAMPRKTRHSLSSDIGLLQKEVSKNGGVHSDDYEVKGWLLMAFTNDELEEAFQTQRAATWCKFVGPKISFTVAILLSMELLKRFLSHIPALMPMIFLAFWIASMLLFGLFLWKRPDSASKSYMYFIDVFVISTVFVCSLTRDRKAALLKEDVPVFDAFMEARSAVLVACILASPIAFMGIPAGHYLLLSHICIGINFTVTIGLGSEEHDTMRDRFSSDARHALNDHVIDYILMVGWYLYLLVIVLYVGGRRQEQQERYDFAIAQSASQQLARVARQAQIIETKYEHLREAWSAIESVAEEDVSRSKTKEGATPVLGPAPAAAAPAAAPKQAPHDKKAPPPKMPALVQLTAKDARVPNPTLVKSMKGQQSNWSRIHEMSRRIRDPDYDLLQFFNDCVAGFPELSLFYAKELKDSVQSGNSGEAEYQRTIGAFFTVYWMLRLDTNGKSGFCYGVDERWQEPADHAVDKQRLEGKSFFNMAPDEKRDSFMTTMNWAMFQDLVKRAGCAKGVPGSEDRITALLALTAFHDIMKLTGLQPIVQLEHAPYYGYEAGVRILDHDLALSYVLEFFPDLLPSYAGLDERQRRAVLFTQGKMQFNHGWFVQAEAPPGGMLKKFKEILQGNNHQHEVLKLAQQQDIDLYFLHWITDLAGAEATPLGGAEKLVLKFPHTVLTSFLWSMPYLSRLADISETELVEQYLEARWKVLMESEDCPTDSSSIAVMRLVVMAQAPDAHRVEDAFHALPFADQMCLQTELARTGCAEQTFERFASGGGPAFLIYYSPALMQRNNDSPGGLEAAMHMLCVVLRGARALWPLKAEAQDNSVIIMIDELKTKSIERIVQNDGDHRNVWVLMRVNSNEGVVYLRRTSDLNGMFMSDIQFRVLDFTLPVQEQEPASEVGAGQSGQKAKDLTLEVRRSGGPTSLGGPRILIFTDMSTECDDECALLWLLAALERRNTPVTVELVQTDSHVRFQWMADIFRSKFLPGGEWELLPGYNAFRVGKVQVNMYLAKSPDEKRVIEDIEKKASHLQVRYEEREGTKIAIRAPGEIGGEDYLKVPGGSLHCVVVAAAIPDVIPDFFKQFTSCKCCYVVGTPGGINCPLGTWRTMLAALHELAPVLYLTPQLTRTIRFPKNYVVTNTSWNETIRHTVWEACLTFMAARPEFPPAHGNCGLILRLNNANASFCRDWYVDVTGQQSVPKPSGTVEEWVTAYVERNAGEDRQLGAVYDELKAVGYDVSLESFGVSSGHIDENGKPITPVGHAAIRKKYKQALYEVVGVCVVTTDVLIFQHKKNTKVTADTAGNEVRESKCDYANPLEKLDKLRGHEDGLKLLQELPLRKLTPAYDVVGMILAEASMDEGTDIDGGLGLLYSIANNTMGLGMLTQDEQRRSNHDIWMTVEQTGAGVYAAGPFS
jgi:hypothetical protein